MHPLRLLAASLVFSSLNAAATGPAATLADQFRALREEKASRTEAERKIQSKLLYLARETSGGRAVAGAPGIRSNLSCDERGHVLVDISAPPSPGLREGIEGCGGIVIYESPRWASVRACLPPAALGRIAARPEVERISHGKQPTTHTGSVTSEGDKAHRADAARAGFGIDGTGVTVGVISDSTASGAGDHAADSIASGDLPHDFTILPGRAGSGIGEGTAMSEIVHDIAPGAKIVFASAVGGKAFFADSIVMLHNAGCDIIVDDISYPNEWQFQDDEIGKAINQVVAGGALYLSSSGNEGNLKSGNSTTWEGDFADGGTDPLLPGGRVHDFGPATYNSMTSDESEVVLQWSDEYNSSANDYDVIVLSADGTTITSAGTDTQDGDDEPIEYADAQPGERIVIWKADAAAARYVRISCTGGPLDIQTAGQTIGHAGTANCVCVASSDASVPFPGAFSSASATEASSSDGPHRMFYHPDGTPMTPGNFLAATGGGTLLQTPAITGADGGATTLPADSGLNPFYGTSAAAPHCAAIAALVLSKDRGLTNSQLRTILETSCIDIEAPGFDNNAGHGILMAELALEKALTPLETWRHSHFGTYLATGDAAPFADPESDGLDNVLEYLTGGDPNLPGTSPLSAASRDGSQFSLTYRIDPDAIGVPWKFERSANLQAGSWTEFVPESNALIETVGGVEVRQVVFDAGGADRIFVRLSAELP